MKRKIRRCRCKNCNDLFKPDPCNLKRQKFCKKSECKEASKRYSQQKWLLKPKNKDYFSASARKLSEVVLEFAEPLIDAADGTVDEEKAIRMLITLWNASLLAKQKGLETISPALDDMAKGDQILSSEFHSIFDMMYERKQNYFSTDNRFIVNYSLEENREGFYLQVASTPMKI
ncbi:hypothetical protein [Desulfobacula sp.]|uniref:hypothetical protein n=1 Tax=Desulfobacula sp. TaxID=2593537 RepID=UPI00261B6F8A|nr:hypothetical protein [Desulfobacula sp.]